MRPPHLAHEYKRAAIGTGKSKTLLFRGPAVFAIDTVVMT
jgi:hypothetical protein